MGKGGGLQALVHQPTSGVVEFNVYGAILPSGSTSDSTSDSTPPVHIIGINWANRFLERNTGFKKIIFGIRGEHEQLHQMILSYRLIS